MIPNPGQFNKSIRKPNQQLTLPGMEGLERRPGHRGEYPKEKKDSFPMRNPKSPLQKPESPHSKDSESMDWTRKRKYMEKLRENPPKEPGKNKDYKQPKRPLHNEQDKSSMSYPSREERRKQTKDWLKQKNKKIDKYNKDDDDKGNSGGASMPRKPKPSPKSPGDYRPIERKTDPDYARKQDRYRVMAR